MGTWSFERGSKGGETVMKVTSLSGVPLATESGMPSSQADKLRRSFDLDF